MKSTISSKGQIVLPAELWRRDGIEPGQTFEIERIDHGEYRLFRAEPPRNQGLVDILLACPEKDWFEPIQSESPIHRAAVVTYLVDANVLSETTRRRPVGGSSAGCRTTSAASRSIRSSSARCASAFSCWRRDGVASVCKGGSTTSGGAYTACRGAPIRGFAGRSCWRVSGPSASRCRSRTASLRRPPSRTDSCWRLAIDGTSRRAEWR